MRNHEEASAAFWWAFVLVAVTGPGAFAVDSAVKAFGRGPAGDVAAAAVEA